MKTKPAGTRPRRTGRTQPIDPRLLLNGKPVTFWLGNNGNPLINEMMKQWGDDLRNLSSNDGYHMIYWLIDQLIKELPDHQPSPEALEFYARMGELSPVENLRTIQAIMHRKKG